MLALSLEFILPLESIDKFTIFPQTSRHILEENQGLGSGWCEIVKN